MSKGPRDLGYHVPTKYRVGPHWILRCRIKVGKLNWLRELMQELSGLNTLVGLSELVLIYFQDKPWKLR